MDLAFSFYYTFFFHFISNQIKDQSWKVFFPISNIPGILHNSDSYATLQVQVKGKFDFYACMTKFWTEFTKSPENKNLC